jgi:hypothetical protein
MSKPALVSWFELFLITLIVACVASFVYTEKALYDMDARQVIREIAVDLDRRAECQRMGGEMILRWSQRHNQFVLDSCKVGALR